MAIRPKSIVPKVGEPDIDESCIRQQDVVLLETLLIDRTMTALNGGSPVNIKWAVDDYAKEYPDRTGYGCEDRITIDAISGDDGKDLKVVTPRVKKRREEQERRTAQKAEVFTPSWICNEQNNLVDEAWFGRKDNLFNKPNPDYKTGSELVETRRRDVYELPVGTVREAICNAVFHRNYLEPSEVYVALYKEVEGWGGGVARYFTDWTAAGLPRPKLEEAPGFFKVVFDRKKRANEPVSEPLTETVKGLGFEHVCEHVCEQVERLVSVCKGEMTEKELREAVGVRNRPNFTVRYLSRALDGGFLERTVVGARAPTQKYRLTSKGAELAVKSVKKGFC